MEVSEVKAIFNKHDAVRTLRWLLGLSNWKIDIVYERLDGSSDRCTNATCVADPAYRDAIIRIDNDAITSEDHALDVLLHEMLHIVHASFHIYEMQARNFVQDSCALQALDVAYNLACENCVAQFRDVLLLGLNHGTTKKLIAATRRRMEKLYAS